MKSGHKAKNMEDQESDYMENEMERILLVEDDMPLATATAFALQAEGYEVVHAQNLADAGRYMEQGQIALVLLDVNLPDGTGYDFCRKLRACNKTVPVIFLTALAEEVNVVQGLDVGGDDYVAKPFRVRELVSRMKANLRRTRATAQSGEVLTCGPFLVQWNRHVVLHGGEDMHLTPSEFRLFVKLMQNKGSVLTRNQLLQELWDIDGSFVDDNTLSVYIRRLREKLRDDKEYISTVRGVGYMFVDKSE